MRYLVSSIIIIFLALVVFFGGRLRLPTIGDLAADSLAYSAGFQSGDKIIRIGDLEISSWESFCLQWAKVAGQAAEVEIQRGSENLKINLQKVPEISPSKFGLKPFSTPAKLALKISSPLKKYGVAEGDELVKLNGVPIAGFGHFFELLKAQQAGVPLNMDFIRKGEDQSYAIGLPGLENNEFHTLDTLGLVHPMNVTKLVRGGSIADKLGVHANDRFILIQGQAADSNFKVAKFTRALRSDQVLKVAVVRGDKVQHLEMKLEDVSPPEEGDLLQIMKFLGITPMSKIAAQHRWPSGFEDLKLALLFQLTGRE